MYTEGQQIAGNFGSSLSVEKSIPHAQEIPEQIDRVGSLMSETSNLLSALHQRLASVMPPSAPEQGAQIGGTTREPSSPLGNQLADFARIAAQNNTSIRYLLERIKL